VDRPCRAWNPNATSWSTYIGARVRRGVRRQIPPDAVWGFRSWASVRTDGPLQTYPVTEELDAPG
jgi:hypothetical protein